MYVCSTRGGGQVHQGVIGPGVGGLRAGKCLWKWRLDYEKLKLNAQIMRLGKLLALESKNKKRLLIIIIIIIIMAARANGF